ncbi:MAG: hypothetical protein R2762_06610 [Bryobacteraceae bacterium]
MAEDPRRRLLAFTEARLAVLPVRSLNRPFFYVTCRLIVERLARDLRALEFGTRCPALTEIQETAREKRGWQARHPGGKALVLEDLVYHPNRSSHMVLSRNLAPTSPSSGFGGGRTTPKNGCPPGWLSFLTTILPDLVQRAIPVRARIQLTGSKTTDKWTNPDTHARKVDEENCR